MAVPVALRCPSGSGSGPYLHLQIWPLGLPVCKSASNMDPGRYRRKPETDHVQRVLSRVDANGTDCGRCGLAGHSGVLLVLTSPPSSLGGTIIRCFARPPYYSKANSRGKASDHCWTSGRDQFYRQKGLLLIRRQPNRSGGYAARTQLRFPCLSLRRSGELELGKCPGMSPPGNIASH